MPEFDPNRKQHDFKSLEDANPETGTRSSMPPQMKLQAGPPMPTPPPTGSDSTATATDSLPGFVPADSLSNFTYLDSLFKDSVPRFTPGLTDTLSTAPDSIPAPPTRKVEKKPKAKTKETNFLSAHVGEGFKNDPKDVFRVIYRLEQIGFLDKCDYQEIAKDRKQWEEAGEGAFPDSAIGEIIRRYQQAIGASTIDGYISPGYTTEKALIEGRTAPIGSKKGKKPSLEGIPEVSESSPEAEELKCIAQAIFAAGQGWGTDEDEIYRHLELLEKDRGKIGEVKKVFCALYDVDLETYLKDELWDWGFWREESKALGMLEEKDVTEDEKSKDEPEPNEEGYIYGPVVVPDEAFITQAAPQNRQGNVKGLLPSEAYGGAKNPQWNASCYLACKKMIENAGFSIQTTIRIGTISLGKREVANTAAEGLKNLDECLINGMPVVVGVDKGYDRKTNPYKTSNGERTETDHFIVIVAKGFDAEKGKQFYSYLDPGRWGKAGHDLKSNRLYADTGIKNGKAIKQKGVYSDDFAYQNGNGDINTYSLCEVRPTN